MIVVCGRFRLPAERVVEARAAMVRVIAASLAEPGCRDYSYAEDVTEPGLFRVHEEWDSREALESHFGSAHMKEWQAVREAFGFHDRDVVACEVGEPTPL